MTNQETQITSILEKYASDNKTAKLKNDLKALMLYEKIDMLLYKIYTPTFNDGDVCEKTIEFVTLRNNYDSRTDAYIYCRDDDMPLYFDEDYIDEDNQYIPDEHLDVLLTETKSYIDKYNMLKDRLRYKYSNPKLEEAISNIVFELMETNTQGTITINKDGLVIKELDYDPDY